MLGYILLEANVIISSIPYIPDLVVENSQGIANGL